MSKNFKAWPEHWPKSQNYPGRPVYNILEQTANRVPYRIAIVFGGMELTFAELKHLADRFASALVDMGVKKGDRVSIHLINCPQFAIAYYGVQKIGAVFSPLSPLLSPREVTYQLNDCGAETLISLDLLYPGIASVIPETKVKNVVTTSVADCYNAVIAPLKPLGKTEVPDTIDMVPLLRKYEPHTESVAIDVQNDLAHLAYTGGTTGLSKGVMLTHANVEANVLQFGNWATGAVVEEKDGAWTTVYPEGVDPATLQIGQDQEIAIVVVPWFHAMGTVGYLNSQVFGGNTMVVLPQFDPREYLEMIVKYQATFIGGAPQLYIPLINHLDFEKYDLSHVKMAGSGAAPLPMAVIDKLTGKFAVEYISEGYGLTECTMGATMTPPSAAAAKAGSVGLPVFDTEVKIVDAADGRELPPGEEGEVLIKGPQVMQGYYNKPEATAEVLEDGWLRTGDIGKMDEDGYLYITDRLKDMIIYKGYNVYPRELEEVLFLHPAVEQCAVVGKPDADVGEAPVAFVKLVEGAQATTEELAQYVNPKVAAYKKVREVVFVDAIPVSGAGKVLKRELRERFEQ
ncbi:MAG: long-chain fatty acid--CoA ligase [Proteobacteria bacterium]|nr:long-chain fatty acid--CoA ligase [Pseudomonadota bacterium]